MRQLTCEILLIGNELLIGKIQDMNGKWLIDQLNPLGIIVSRVTIIRDEMETIARTIKESLKRHPKYILTSGGLGPTFDDMTIASISKGLGSDPLKLDPNLVALNWIRDRYRTYLKKNPNKYPPGTTAKDLLTESRVKMARMPTKAIPLFNPVGSAPGVLFPPEITNGFTSIFCMPGIPRELQAIFHAHIFEKIQDTAEKFYFIERRLEFLKLGESDLSGFVSKIRNNYPGIWIKTHPKHDLNAEKEPQYYVELHLTMVSEDLKEGELQIEELLDILQEYVREHGGKIRPCKRD